MPAQINNEINFCSLNTAEGVLMVPYELRRSRRSRYLRLTITPEKQAVLTMPLGFSEKQALNFLQEKADWVGSQLKTRRKKRVGLLAYLQKKPNLSFYGCKAELSISFTDAKSTISWDIEKKTVNLSLNSKHPLEEQIVNLLRQFAAKVIPPQVHRAAEKYQIEVGRVSVRDQSSQWGSCSGKRTLSLNWRLILLPPELQEYVILHELAHLTHLNHSDAFWNLLKKYDSKTQLHDRRISRIGGQIINLGRLR